MRWSIIRLIWLRELRDQLRDRRTLFMIAVLPLLLYPVLGFAVLQFALGMIERQSVIGIEYGPQRSSDFPEPAPPTEPKPEELVRRHCAWLSLTPAQGFPGNVVGAWSLAFAPDWASTYPPLIRMHDGKAVNVAGASWVSSQASLKSDKDPTLIALMLIKFEFIEPGDAQEELAQKRIDLLLSAPPDFFVRLAKDETDGQGERAVLKIQSSANHDRYAQARQRLNVLLEYWKKSLKSSRFSHRGLPAHFDEPFVADETLVDEKTAGGNQQKRILDLMIRVFPFMLVMWSLAGALYPAVDLCAGEKERGTMETLLISPAGREEIVLGKFLTIWVFSGGTALLNLGSMGVTTWYFSKQLPLGSLPVEAMLWCMALLLPLSAFFSAISLAVGAYARSTKEGQYYLMPLFLITMPLMFLTLAPGVELNPFYSLVPVTGAALLMQKLMTTSSLTQVEWLYFIPVLAPIALYSFLALRWAIDQFQREEVLFREAERLDLRLWFRRLFREKEETPTTGQAFFVFAMVLALHWLSLSIGQQLPPAIHSAIRLLAFVAAPPLLLTMLLNTKPTLGLRLKWPRLSEIGLGALLSVLLLPPLAYASWEVLTNYPAAAQLMQDRQPLVQELQAVVKGQDLHAVLPYVLLLALLPAVCEEVFFRGFLLTGMLKHFRPRTAVALVSFLFALYYMNVFLFLPAFFLGVVLGLLTLRSRSLVPAMIFHFLCKSVLIVGVHVFDKVQYEIPHLVQILWLPFISISLVSALVLLWRLYRAPYWAKLWGQGPLENSPLGR